VALLRARGLEAQRAQTRPAQRCSDAAMQQQQQQQQQQQPRHVLLSGDRCAGCSV